MSRYSAAQAESSIDGTAPTGEPHVVAASDAERREEIRAELVGLLMHRQIPDKDEILHVKQLVETLTRGDAAPGGPRRGDTKPFLSAYFDLYLGRMAGRQEIEQSGLDRCLQFLGMGGASSGRARGDGGSWAS